MAEMQEKYSPGAQCPKGPEFRVQGLSFVRVQGSGFRVYTAEGRKFDPLVADIYKQTPSPP